MKKRFVMVAMVVVLIVMFTLPVKHARAGTLPTILFTDTGRVIIQVANLGVLGGNEWEIAVYTEWPSPTNMGICMRFYYPGRAEFGIPVLGDAYWYQHGRFGVWAGSGSYAYAINPIGGTWAEVLTTSPADLPASSAEALDQR